MNSLRMWLAPLSLVLWMVAHLSLLWAAPSTAATDRSATNPLPNAALPLDERFTFEGTIEERIDTGDYRYMRVNGTWVVSLALTSPREGRVRVTAIGRATNFASRRLGRLFDVLVFGVVRAAEAAPSQESETP
jgi:hypothetical protein